MSSWYAGVKDSNGVDAHKHVVANNTSQQSQTLSGRGESPSNGSTYRPWSGKLHEKTSPTGFSNAYGKEKRR